MGEVLIYHIQNYAGDDDDEDEEMADEDEDDAELDEYVCVLFATKEY